jgi:hypothetical protein
MNGNPNMNSDTYVAPFIRKLMPGASEEELIDATDNFAELIKLCIEIQLEHAGITEDDLKDYKRTKPHK